MSRPSYPFKQASRSLVLLLIMLPMVSGLAAAATLQAGCKGSELAVFDDHAGAWLSDRRREALSLPSENGESYRHLVAIEDGWLLAGERPGNGGTEIFLLRGGDGSYLEGSMPLDADSARSAPRLLVDARGLRGMVWLEGDMPRALGVRFAQLGIDGWSRPAWLSPPTAASQTALAAIVLADGSWLAVWSAFDGNDDEILYSHFRDDSWSAPQRLSADNRVPDVTPALAPTSGGAIVAWSRYDGNDYRLRTARFGNGRWLDEEWLGERGSAFPSFHLGCDDDSGPLLLFRSVATNSWSLVDYSASGGRLSLVEVQTERRDRPIVRLGEGREPTLEWPKTGLEETDDRLAREP